MHQAENHPGKICSEAGKPSQPPTTIIDSAWHKWRALSSRQKKPRKREPLKGCKRPRKDKIRSQGTTEAMRRRQPRNVNIKKREVLLSQVEVP